jgi:hypothetical protein
MNTIPIKITNTIAVIPFTIHCDARNPNRVNQFGRELLEAGWTIVPATRENFLVLTDWCAMHFDDTDFGYNTIVRAFIFKHAAEAIQFKLACLNS